MRYNHHNSHRAWVALLLLVVCIGPALYWAHIIAVVVHEVIGHGLVALLLGGRFDGFMISPDAFGWAHAYIPYDAEGYLWRQSLVYAGGSVSTFFVGLIFLAGLARLPKLSAPARLSILIAAYALLTEGTSYLFFTSIHPTGGDWAIILELSGHPIWMRWAFVLIGAIGFLSAIVGCFWYGLRTWAGVLQSWGVVYESTGFMWVAVPGVLIALPAFVFNWDQLAPGLWYWPNIFMLVIESVLSFTLAIRGFKHPEVELGRPATRAGWALIGIVNTTLSIAIFGLCWLVFQHEVLWGP